MRPTSRKISTAAFVVAPLLLGALLAVSNWRLVRENRRLDAEVHLYESLRHTQVGAVLPTLHGKGLDGQDLTVSYGDVSRRTLLMVFSPTCPHCKRNWPEWLDVARNAPANRAVFVNVGGPLPPNFSDLYSFDSAPVIAEASPESILQYSLLEFPLTILISPAGRVERVWVGELAPADVSDIKKLTQSAGE